MLAGVSREPECRMPTLDRILRFARRAAVCALIATAAAPLHARQGEPPYTLTHPEKAGGAIPLADVGAIDAAQRRFDSDSKSGAAPTKRRGVADAVAVSIRSDRDGAWETLDDGSALWRIAVRVAGATDLRLAFARFALPAGAAFYVIGADGYYQGPYTAADAPGQVFHSSVVPGETATIELRIPHDAGCARGALELTQVGAGFRDVLGRAKATLDTGPGTSGACNVNVACPLGQAYPEQIRAVGYFEYFDDDERAYYICTGTLMADVPHDRRNYFLTAAHCISSAAEAGSMVVYWNYESAQCSGLVPPPGGFLNDDQHGATLRAARADADFALVELAQAPDPAWNVYYAGWDASGTIPSGTIGIHHPSGDVKKITAGPRPSTTDNCIGTGGSSSGTHWWTGPYSQGTTEGGSSGSGLFVSAGAAHEKLLIGTLSGGFAACSASNPSVPNGDNDCYGKLAAGWNGASSATRLRDWLDPAGTGALTASGNDSEGAAPSNDRGHSTHRRPPGRTGAGAER